MKKQMGPPEEKQRLRAVRIGRLGTPLEVAAELGRVYRHARHNQLDSAIAARLAQILLAMRQCLETAALETRLAELEELVGKAGTAPQQPTAAVLALVKKPNQEAS